MEVLHYCIDPIKKVWNKSKVLTILGALGLGFLIAKTCRITKKAWKYMIASSTDLWKRYGSKDCYAVVSGACELLGFSYARVLAKAGFNLILVGTNDSELLMRREDILKEAASNNKAQPTVIVCQLDLTQPFSERAYNSFISIIQGKDIAIFINCEDYLAAASFAEMKEKNIADMINTNIHGFTYLVRLLLPGMVDRKVKSCVIAVSSYIAHLGIPYCAIYAGTHAYIRALVNCLSLEYREKNIEFLNVEAGPLTTFKSTKAEGWTVASEELAEKHLSFAGKYTFTHGCLLHFLQYKFGCWCKGKKKEVGEALKASSQAEPGK